MAMSSTETAISISRKKRFSFGALTIVLITAILFAFLTFTSETFFTYRNIYAIFYGVSFQFIAVIGFTYLMIIGEIDLSVGSIYAFSGMFMGYLMVMKDVPLLPAMGLSLLVCVVMGALTGFLIVRFKLKTDVRRYISVRHASSLKDQDQGSISDHNNHDYPGGYP